MKHPKKSIKELIAEANSLFQEAKNKGGNNKNEQQILKESLLKCEKAYDVYLSLDEKDNEEQFRLEFNLAALYLLSSENAKCLYYLEKLKRNDMNKSLNERRCKQLGYMYAKLADNFRLQQKQQYHEQGVEGENYEKILLSYRSAAEYFERLNYIDKDDDDAYVKNADFNLYCQILITIAKYSNVKYAVEESFIDKILSVCKSLENEEVKAKIYSDLSTIIVRLNKDMSNFQRAESLLNKAIALTSNENLFIKGILYHNLGAVYNRYCEYDKAIQSLRKVIEAFDGDKVALTTSLKKQLGDVYFNLGYAHAKLYCIEEARHAFTETLKYLEGSQCDKNKVESLAALGTLSIMNNEEEVAVEYFQNALEVHRAFELKDSTHVQIEKLLRSKIDGLKKRIQLNNSFKSIHHNNNTYETIDFLNDLNTKDLKIATSMFNKMSMLKSDLTETPSRKGSLKRGILKLEDDRPVLVKKFSEKRKSVLFIDSLPAATEMDNTSGKIDSNASTLQNTNTNRLVIDMELSTKQPSGAFLEPVKKNNESIENNKNENSDDDDNELKKSQKELFANYVQNIQDYENSMEKEEQRGDLGTKTDLKNHKLPDASKKKIDVDVIERVDGGTTDGQVEGEIVKKKERSKICAIM